MRVIAHRGASADAPENTIASFRLAGRQCADGIEGDFRLTADHRIVCLHDPSTRRTGDGTYSVERKRCRLDPRQIVVIAFNARLIRRLKKVLPEVKTLWLRKTPSSQNPVRLAEKWLRTLKAIRADGMDAAEGQAVCEPFMEVFHRASKEVHVWEWRRRRRPSGLRGSA